METQDTSRDTQLKNKQALEKMLKRPTATVPPPQITQAHQRQPQAPTSKPLRPQPPVPKIPRSQPQATTLKTRSSILDDAQGSRRRSPQPTSTLPLQHAKFTELLEVPDYTAPRASVMSQAHAALEQPRMPMQRSRSVPVSFPSSTSSLSNVFIGRPLLLVSVIFAISILILLRMYGSTEGSYKGYWYDGKTATTNILKAFAPAQAVLPQAPNGEHSILGASSITADQIDAVLTKYNSPAVGTGQIWIALGKQYNINPAYALAFFIHESSAGTASGWAGWKPDGSSTHNVGNIICAGYATCYNRFRDYPGWQEGIADWYRLIATEYVEGRGVFTIEQIIPIYAPSFENNVPAYVQTVTDLVKQWHH